MAMAYGDEFDSDNIDAYQLAEFSANCHLNRTLITNRL